MTLIDEVARLKMLEANTHYPYLVYVQTDMQTSCACKTDEDAHFVRAMRNAAPGLLEVAGAFQPEDDIRLGFVASGEFDPVGCGCEQCMEAVDMLRRLQAAAKLLEED